jgi:Rrf2 family protein
MIGIGRHTDYASRIVLHLASLGAGAQVTAGDISAKRLLPPAFVRRIIGKLAEAGIVRTTRGAGGGVSLARPPSEISLLDVVTAMEGGLVLNVCVDTPLSCPLAVTCPVNKAWCEATAALTASLGAVRFDRLANPTERSVARAGYPKRPGSRSQPTPPAGRRRSG